VVGPEPILENGDPFINEIGVGEDDHSQAPLKSKEWQGIGLRSGSGADFDLYVADGPAYDSFIASSSGGLGMVDLVMVDGRQSGLEAVFPLARHYSGNQDFEVEYGASAGELKKGQSSAEEPPEKPPDLRVQYLKTGISQHKTMPVGVRNRYLGLVALA